MSFAEENRPAHALAVSLILNHIDAHPGTIKDKTQQLDLLETLTRKYELRYHSSTYRDTFHDRKSLRNTLSAIARRHAVPGLEVHADRNLLDLLFERGSKVLSPDYVRAVHEAAASERKTSNSSVQGSEDGEERDEGEEEDLKAVEARNDISEDEDYVPQGRRSAKATKGRSRILSTSTSTTHDSDSVYGPSNNNSVHPDVVQDVVKIKEEDEIAVAPKRKVSFVDELSMPPRKKPAVPPAITSKRRGKVPPPRPGASLRKTDLATSQKESVEDRESSQLLRDAKALQHKIAAAVSGLMTSLAVNDEEDIELAFYPAPPLASLYAQVFGSSNWKSGATELLTKNAVPPGHFLRSLIAAFLHTRVLRPSNDSDEEDSNARLPWSSPLDFKSPTSTFQQYVAPLLAAEHGVDVTAMINKAASIQLHDEHFRANVLEPMAWDLACDLRMSLNAQLQILIKSQNGVDADWSAKLLKDLQAIMADALLLHARLEMTGGQYRWLWFKRGEAWDGRYMQVVEGEDGSNVGLTVFPGLHKHGQRDMCSQACVVLL